MILRRKDKLMFIEHWNLTKEKEKNTKKISPKDIFSVMKSQKSIPDDLERKFMTRIYNVKKGLCVDWDILNIWDNILNKKNE